MKQIKSVFEVLKDSNLGDTDSREYLKCALVKTKKARAYRGLNHKL